MSLDGKLILAVRALHTFGHSTALVLLAIYLDLQGFSLVELGLLLTIGSSGAAFWALIAGLVGDAVGRRRLLIVTGLLMSLMGCVLIMSRSFPLLATAVFLGSFSVMASASGAMGPLEQASLPATAPPERRTDTFALYGRDGCFVPVMRRGWCV
jgi:MFS family permease